MSATPGRKVAVVTGAGRGIGRATAFVLAERGFDVAVVDRDAEAAAAVAGELDGARVVVADVSTEEGVAAMAAEVVRAYGRWDVLVNNAGRLGFGTVESTSVEEWDAIFAGCVRSAWLSLRAAVPQMRRGGGGRVVNVASVVAHGADSSGLVAYTAAKAAVIGLTTAAARELGGPGGIAVNAVSPGTVETEAWERFPDPGSLREVRSAATVMRRVAQPREIAEAIAFLASSAAGYVTGQVLVVDGGRTDKL